MPRVLMDISKIMCKYDCKLLDNSYSLRDETYKFHKIYQKILRLYEKKNNSSKFDNLNNQFLEIYAKAVEKENEKSEVKNKTKEPFYSTQISLCSGRTVYEGFRYKRIYASSSKTFKNSQIPKIRRKRRLRLK